jgi:hypothetical protein
VRLLGLRGRRDLASADRPHGLVRDHDAAVGVHMRQLRAIKGSRDVPPILRLCDGDNGAQLLLDDVLRASRLALCERLANAEDDGQTRIERGACFCCDELGSLMEEAAAFGVTYIHMRHYSDGRAQYNKGGLPRITYGIVASASCDGLWGAGVRYC